MYFGSKVSLLVAFLLCKIWRITHTLVNFSGQRYYSVWKASFFVL